MSRLKGVKHRDVVVVVLMLVVVVGGSCSLGLSVCPPSSCHCQGLSGGGKRCALEG